jgi:carbamoyl-phosphate synthase large subunit
LKALHIPHPKDGTATSLEEAMVIAQGIGYPVLVRPA